MRIPFFYDMLFKGDSSLLATWPWQEEDPVLPYLWEERQQIRTAFHRRQSEQAKGLMLHAVSAFIDHMVWTANRPVRTLSPVELTSELQALPFAPLNLQERLKYIFRQPDRYISFIQLDNLQEELTKKLAVYHRMKKSLPAGKPLTPPEA
ncbi:YpoC family protein [Sporolactobacillus sp. Y61]|uniref:YpoC family protein n=1 Tax=Sporolactobacillus sp. Y61 TaxID=3160863 RepID=A0AAU8IDC9_9BACL